MKYMQWPDCEVGTEPWGVTVYFSWCCWEMPVYGSCRGLKWIIEVMFTLVSSMLKSMRSNLEWTFKFYVVQLIPRYLESYLFGLLRMISKFSACCSMNVSLYDLYNHIIGFNYVLKSTFLFCWLSLSICTGIVTLKNKN